MALTPDHAYTNTAVDFSDEEKVRLDDDQPPPYIGVTDLKLEMEEAAKKDLEEGKEKKEKEDLFDIKNVNLDDMGPSWSEMSGKQKAKRVLTTVFGILFALGLLYIFICSLDVLQSAFQLLTGRIAGDAFSNNAILSNPMAGLVLGVLATVLLQSSSTSTSIVVTLVGAGVIGVKQGIYIIMGANIGTSVTNTIVSMTQSGDKDTFRRSFAGATVHDMFNWLTVIILLPIEAGANMIFRLTELIVKNINPQTSDSDEPQFLKVITDPLTGRIVKVDKNVLNDVATGSDRAKYPLCKYYCDFVYDSYNETWPTGEENETFIESIREKPWTINIELKNLTMGNVTLLSWDDINTNESEICTHHFTGCGVEDTWCSLSDQAVGGILFAASLIILLSSVIIMVKLLGVILRGPVAKAIQVGINSDLPGKAKFLTGYLAILMGAGLTMLVQSSSVFTSTLTPLVGLGLVSVERMYPLSLGSNIGTCLTGMLAALTADASKIQDTLQVAFGHLFFNIFGIMLFYPVPHLRKLPIMAAKFMGNVTAEYRWFALAYIICLFLIFPGAIFGLSLAGWKVLVGVLAPIGAVIIAIVIIKVMQHYCPQKMVPVMRNWHWLPLPLRSLAPCNNVITKCCYSERCIQCRRKHCCMDDDSDSEDDASSSSSYDEPPSPTSSVSTIGDKRPIVEFSKKPSQDPSTILDIGQSNPAYDSEGGYITKL